MNMEPSITLLSHLFDSFPLGIVVLDTSGKVVVYNRFEEQLAGRRRADAIGRDFFVEVAPCMNVRQLGGAFTRDIGKTKVDLDVEFSFPFPFLDEPRDVRVQMRSFEVASVWYAALLIQDVSSQASVERMKETLQSMLVHDLKNPLAAVIGNLGYLESLQMIRDNQDAAEAISDSIRSSRRLNAMLLNLLDITRLETNTFPLQRTMLDVRELLASVAEGNSAMAKLRGARISVVSEPMPLFADPAILRRAFDNLIENALRYAKHITLSASRTASTLHIEVRDDGPGIPEPMRVAIFEKYGQVKDAKRTSDNRGLGLTFVRLAARAHGGDVAVLAPAGGGTSFRFSLPDRSPG